jgi:FKBP-type peptidyl-prolyl cis-trans isomerase SlyD
MEITKEKVVTVEYTLRDEANQVVDTSTGRAPLTYVHGMGGMIPGFEAALEGKRAKESLAFVVEPSQGYGERNESLLFPVPRDRFQDIEDLEVGMQIQAQTPHGVTIMTISRIDEQAVVLDGNHPMAGKSLFFEVQVLDVRDATREELEHVHCGHEQGCDSTCCGSCESTCGE